MKCIKPNFNGKDKRDVWYKQPLNIDTSTTVLTSHILGVCSFKTILMGSSIYYKFN